MITIVITFVVVCAIALVVLESLLAGSGALRVLRVALASLGLGCLAAGLACAVVRILLGFKLRESIHGDVWLVRRLARVVLEGRRQELRSGEQREAVAYAAAMTVTLPFQVAFVVLVFVGSCLEVVQLLLAGGALSFVVPGLAALLLGLSAVFTQFLRLRRARAYAQEDA